MLDKSGHGRLGKTPLSRPGRCPSMRVGIAVALAAAFATLSLAGCATPADLSGPCSNRHGTPDFCGGGAWINSEPLTLAALEGKVVLIDFWTYTCINCIRTFPHLTAWYDTYAPFGFVIVGVHAPEFEFEEDRDNVVAATARHAIHYPVVQDNDMAIWDAWENRYWPAHYLLDASGDEVFRHFGEGKYAETEAKIRDLLVKAGARGLPAAIEPIGSQGARGSDVTPELYAGYGRQASAIGNPEGYQPEKEVDYSASSAPQRDRIYFDGTWHNGEEAMTAASAAAFYLRFRAGAVNMVVFPGAAAGTCLPVRLDGEPIPAELAGADVLFDRGVPCVLVDAADSYDLYAGPVATHELRVGTAAGLALYTFAFSAYAA